jgi:hypothetical protein
MDKAYSDKLDGKIAEEFWQRLMTEWRMEEQQVKMAIRVWPARKPERGL